MSDKPDGDDFILVYDPVSGEIERAQGIDVLRRIAENQSQKLKESQPDS